MNETTSSQTPASNPISIRRRGARAALVLLLLLLGGCGAAEAVRDVASDAASEAGTLVGRFNGERPHAIVMIDPGFAMTASLVADLEPLVADLAEQGGTLEAFVLPGRSASQTAPVTFSAEANGGVLEPSGGSPEAWEREADTYTAAVLDELASAIEKHRPEAPQGADLFGALGRVIDATNDRRAAIADDRRVVGILLTGGGVHAAGEVSMLEPLVTVASAEALADSAIAAPVAAGATVTVAGVGHMPGVSIEVLPSLVDGIAATWEPLCDRLGCGTQQIPSLGHLLR